jgi:peptidyl-tRNA hydrolase, PTH2 family
MRIKQMIVMRRDLHMRKGKIAAQAGHACVNAVLEALARDGTSALHVDDGMIHMGEGTVLNDWFAQGEAKVCVYVDSEEALLDIHQKALEAGILSVLIQDSGLTEFHGEPTYTCLAFEPCEADKVDPLTGNLPLF